MAVRTKAWTEIVIRCTLIQYRLWIWQKEHKHALDYVVTPTSSWVEVGM